jgi:hypothetical protein
VEAGGHASVSGVCVFFASHASTSSQR